MAAEKQLTTNLNTGPYQSDGVTFGFVKKPDKNGYVQGSFGLNSCRDVLLSGMVQRGRLARNYATLNFNDPHLLVHFSRNREGRIKDTLRVLHMIEDYMGLEQKTEMRPVKSSSVGMIAYLIRVPKIWVKAPPATSLYTLLIRFMIKNSTFYKVKTIAGIANKIDKARINNPDFNYLHQLGGRRFKIFIRNIERIFGKSERKEMFEKYSGHHGIHNFQIGSFNDKLAKNRFERLSKVRTVPKKAVTAKKVGI